ncbi:MAG TPA: GldM family protein, partial [Bacteroidia bacterium]|nr:GldM family protein [Bacteroidia bacterium]
DTRDPQRTEDESSRNWELNTFFHTPLAAAITILSKFETDARDAEAEVVEHLLARSNGETIPFDTVAAKVVSESNYVLVGEKYKADVFIAAFNKTLKTDVLSGDYDLQTRTFKGTSDAVPVVKGMGKYTADASSEGFKTVKGIIRMVTPKGKTFEYPYESEYIVAKPSLTVSADKMNVMYAGLANPVSVSVPGVANSKLQPVIDNGRLVPKGDGHYEVVGAHAGKAHIQVIAEMGNGEKRPMGMIEFRVKNLPKPTAKIGELAMNGKMKREVLAVQGSVQCFYDPNFEFQSKASVTTFSVVITQASGLESRRTFNGCIFNDDIRQIIRKAPKGSTVRFEDIKAVGADQNTVSLDPIAITVQ